MQFLTYQISHKKITIMPKILSLLIAVSLTVLSCCLQIFIRFSFLLLVSCERICVFSFGVIHLIFYLVMKEPQHLVQQKWSLLVQNWYNCLFNHTHEIFLSCFHNVGNIDIQVHGITCIRCDTKSSFSLILIFSKQWFKLTPPALRLLQILRLYHTSPHLKLMLDSNYSIK